MAKNSEKLNIIDGSKPAKAPSLEDDVIAMMMALENGEKIEAGDRGILGFLAIQIIESQLQDHKKSDQTTDELFSLILKKPEPDPSAIQTTYTEAQTNMAHAAYLDAAEIVFKRHGISREDILKFKGLYRESRIAHHIP